MMNRIEDKYRSIALDWINNKFNDFTLVCSKYYPNLKNNNALKATASRLLTNVNFIRIKNELISKIDKNKESKAEDCLNQLYALAINAQKEGDKIVAATSYCKFVIGDKTKTTLEVNPDEQEELNKLRQGIISNVSN